jgi:hypothetical protein
MTSFNSDWKSRSDVFSADKNQAQEGFKTIVPYTVQGSPNERDLQG